MIVDFLGICVSIFGLYCVVRCLRFVLPCFIIPIVSSILSNAEQALTLAVATGAIPEANHYRVDLDSLSGQFARMRIDSHLSPGLFPQLRLAVRHGLSRKLYLLASQVESLRLEVEVVLDEWRLASLASPQIVVRAATPFPTDVAMPVPALTPPEPSYVVH